jgi:ketosteroid isomerase-like protein
MADGTKGSKADLARSFWERLQARQLDEVRKLLADDFVVEWPHSGERFVGADEYIRVTQGYPDDWSITILRVVAGRDGAATEVRVDHAGAGPSFGASFFAIEGDVITSVTEYWVEPEKTEPLYQR